MLEWSARKYRKQNNYEKRLTTLKKHIWYKARYLLRKLEKQIKRVETRVREQGEENVTRRVD